MAKLRAGGNGGDEAAPEGTPPTTPPVVQPELKPLGRQILSSGEAEFEEILPELAGAPRERDPFPRVPAQSAFFLVFAPDRWDVLEGKLVPSLYRLSLTPGANGVTRGSGGRPDPGEAIVQVERTGHFILPWNIGGDGNYLRAFQIGLGQDRRSGAPVKVYSWHTRWEQLFAGSEVIQSDTAAYAEWLSGLVERGLLPRPRPYVVERLRRQYETALHKRMAKDGNEAVCADYKRRIRACIIEQERANADRTPVAAVDATPELEGAPA